MAIFPLVYQLDYGSRTEYGGTCLCDDWSQLPRLLQYRIDWLRNAGEAIPNSPTRWVLTSSHTIILRRLSTSCDLLAKGVGALHASHSGSAETGRFDKLQPLLNNPAMFLDPERIAHTDGTLQTIFPKGAFVTDFAIGTGALFVGYVPPSVLPAKRVDKDLMNPLTLVKLPMPGFGILHLDLKLEMNPNASVDFAMDGIEDDSRIAAEINDYLADGAKEYSEVDASAGGPPVRVPPGQRPTFGTPAPGVPRSPKDVASKYNRRLTIAVTENGPFCCAQDFVILVGGSWVSSDTVLKTYPKCPGPIP